MGKRSAESPAANQSLFSLREPFPPAGDQPEAIRSLLKGLEDGLLRQSVLGVTGSGKTYTLAQVIAKYGRPTLIMAPNKTLAAQLYAEFRDFFPDNAVEYFVSYYDYYQPEAYVPARDLFIEKDSAINEHIEQMRLSATKSLLERKDAIIVATVSAIYGLGSPESYHEMILSLRKGSEISRSEMLRRLVGMQYSRGETEFKRGTFRARGDTIDIFPAEHSKDALRVELFGDEVERLSLLDGLTGQRLADVPRFNIYPATHYAIPEDSLKKAVERIKEELEGRLAELGREGKAIEAARLKTRTEFDLEMLEEGGFCKGIENYSRHLAGKAAGEPPATLLDYLPKDALLVLDESHVTIPQIGGMSKGDRARKENLVNFGFRLPSALDNRPLNFEEFEKRMPPTIYVSATPAEYEKKTAQATVELVVRPTGVLDPEIEVRPAQTQIDDLLGEIKAAVKKGWRVLVTSLTKKMAEKVSDFLVDQGIRAKYLHSDVDNIERVELIRGLRKGDFDVLVGINLLREGLDMPEVARVAILDADKEGFLRSSRSLIQTIGRAARNPHGKAILYADKITESMREAIEETERRRKRQMEHNQKHGIIPVAAKSEIKELIDGVFATGSAAKSPKGGKKESGAGDSGDLDAALGGDPKKLGKLMAKIEKEMLEAAKNLRFEEAAAARDRLAKLEEIALRSAL